jgi:hypothetical protein
VTPSGSVTNVVVEELFGIAVADRACGVLRKPHQGPVSASVPQSAERLAVGGGTAGRELESFVGAGSVETFRVELARQCPHRLADHRQIRRTASYAIAHADPIAAQPFQLDGQGAGRLQVIAECSGIEGRVVVTL